MILYIVKRLIEILAKFLVLLRLLINRQRLWIWCLPSFILRRSNDQLHISKLCKRSIEQTNGSFPLAQVFVRTFPSRLDSGSHARWIRLFQFRAHSMHFRRVQPSLHATPCMPNLRVHSPNLSIEPSTIHHKRLFIATLVVRGVVLELLRIISRRCWELVRYKSCQSIIRSKARYRKRKACPWISQMNSTLSIWGEESVVKLIFDFEF